MVDYIVGIGYRIGKNNEQTQEQKGEIRLGKIYLVCIAHVSH